MDAINLLLKRVSVPRLQEPAPNAEQLEIMLRAALRAPDHGQLCPYLFLTIQGNSRHALGELFVEGLLTTTPDADSALIEKTRAMPLRAPLLVLVIATLTEQHKVPTDEQMITAGCAAHGILLAAQAQGLGAVWSTGPVAQMPSVNQGLGLQANEHVVAYMYLGTPINALRNPPVVDPAPHVQAWPQ